MKIYCAGAIKGDIRYQDYYKTIIQIVMKEKHFAISELNTVFNIKKNLTDKEIFERDIEWLKESNKMIAEVSGPSLGVGFEIAYALYVLKLPVLALYNISENRISAMITGCNSNLLITKCYANMEQLHFEVTNFLNS